MLLEAILILGWIVFSNIVYTNVFVTKIRIGEECPTQLNYCSPITLNESSYGEGNTMAIY